MQLIHKCSVIARLNRLLTNYYFEILLNKVIVCFDEVSASNAKME